MNVVLVEPEIPQNTGNIGRLCLATNSTLHLVEPLGFRLDDRQLKRAGMDYWSHLEWRRWKDWRAFTAERAAGARLWFIESGGPRHYAEVAYGPDDYLVFGRESAGLPASLLETNKAHCITIPMWNESARSLNLATAVAIVLYEALRQTRHF